MKNLTTILILSLSLFVMSCGGDDNCTVDDWVGTWSGQLDCNDDDLNDMITLTVTKVDENTLLFDDGSDTFEVPLTGCRITSSVVEDTFVGEVEANTEANLNGDSMDWDVSAKLLGVSIDCSATLARN